jgi:hypothetical protein
MRVLFIGQVPDTVDFKDPALNPGMTAAAIQAGIDRAMADMAARGWEAALCLVRPDETAVRDVLARLGAARFDCVVIGGGLRVPARGLLLFEAILNAVHRAAPDAAIAFNTRPEDTAAAAERWVKTASP